MNLTRKLPRLMALAFTVLVAVAPVQSISEAHVDRPARRSHKKRNWKNAPLTKRDRAIMRRSRLPRWLRPVMIRACKRAHVSTRWVMSTGLYQLIKHESSFRPHAQNPYSTAYGLFQFLDSTWRTVGGHKTGSPHLQCVYGLRYVKQRYGTPTRAWSFWRAHHWY